MISPPPPSRKSSRLTSPDTSNNHDAERGATTVPTSDVHAELTTPLTQQSTSKTIDASVTAATKSTRTAAAIAVIAATTATATVPSKN